MKKLSFLLLLALCACNTTPNEQKSYLNEVTLTNFKAKVDHISVAKYSKVYMSTYIEGVPVVFENDNGYYYKQYSFVQGDSVLIKRLVVRYDVHTNGIRYFPERVNIDEYVTSK